MLVEVLRDFKDKDNNALCKKGVKIDFSEERINEINNAGYGELVKVLEEKPPTEDIKISDIKINELKVDELKQFAKILGLEIKSNERKDDIVEKINEEIKIADLGDKTLKDLATE